MGPNFKEKQTMSGFENINVHPLMCKLLDLDSKQSSGTAKDFEPYLRSLAIRLDKSLNLLYVFTLAIIVKKLDFNIF